MKRISLNSTMMLVAIVSIAFMPHAFAQEWAGLRNRMIETTYVLPRNPANMPTYLIFKDQQVLEELSAFLSPLRLPTKLAIKTKECGFINLYYAHDEGVVLCYEFSRALWRLVSDIRTPKGFTRRDVFVGTFVLVTLHEVGHAVFDLLKVPVLGRQEDAADQVAALIMLNFGEEFAHRNVSGAARFFRALDRPMSRTAYSDEHGSAAQRFYNILCVAYGGQPEAFKDIAGILPKARAAHCGREYQQVEFAFAKTIWPNVDEELFKKVKLIKWASWQGEIEKTGDLARILSFLPVVVAWGAVMAFLIAKVSSSVRELFRQMTTFGPAAFRGRLGRIHWWAYTLTAILLANALSFALGFFEVDFASPQPLRVVHSLLVWTILIVQWYWHAVFVTKRLHDRNKYGWLAIFWLAPWALAALISAFPDLAEAPFLVGSLVLSTLPWVWIFIEIAFRRGTQGPNRFGPEIQYDVVPQVASPVQV
jgi:uncharacterized membrane protein YhaH (DUF805 family)